MRSESGVTPLWMLLPNSKFLGATKLWGVKVKGWSATTPVVHQTASNTGLKYKL